MWNGFEAVQTRLSHRIDSLDPQKTSALELTSFPARIHGMLVSAPPEEPTTGY